MAIRERQDRVSYDIASEEAPRASRSVEDVQGHWLLARLGKRVLGMAKTMRARTHVLQAVGIVAVKAGETDNGPVRSSSQVRR